MRSKVISGSARLQAPRLKKGTTIASMVGSRWHRLSFSSRLAPTFYAPLSGTTLDLFGAQSVFTRGADGLYLSGGLWRMAASGAPRFEDGQLLMEAAATNFNTNWNTNPDAGLVNITPGAATVSRVADQATINEAGLQLLATDGNVIDITNTSGADTQVIIGTSLPAAGDFYVQLFIKVLTGLANINLGVTTQQPILDGTINRFSFPAPGTGGAAQLRVVIGNNAQCRMLLNCVTEEPSLSTPIITQGATASRAEDELHWTNASNFFNQTEGMVVLNYNPQHTRATLPTTSAVLVSTTTATNGYVMYILSNQLRTFDGLGVSFVALPDFAANDKFTFVTLWGPSGKQVGYKYNGAWSWSAVTTYDGAYGFDGLFRLGATLGNSTRFSDLQVYDKNQGPSWVEANI